MQEEMISLPSIPSEIPRAPSLENVPHYVRISKTVESLIGQNEDLMARLKVSLRQNTLLESELNEKEQSSRQISEANSKLSSHVEIMVEKENLLRSKVDHQDLELEEMRNTLNESHTSKKHFAQLSSYQRRVRLWVRAYISKLNYHLKLMKQKNEELENDLIEQQKKTSGLKSDMSKVNHTLQIKEREHQKDKIKLIEDFENKTFQMSKHNEILLNENKILKQKVQFFGELELRAGNYQGQAQSLEKKYSDLSIEHSKLSDTTSKERLELLTQLEFLKHQTQSLKERSIELETQNRTLSAKCHEALSRHEAMSSLWSEGQLQRAQLKLKNESIIKLNRDLSQRLKDQKKMINTIEAMSHDDREAQVRNIKEIENLMSEIETAVLAQPEIEKS